MAFAFLIERWLDQPMIAHHKNLRRLQLFGNHWIADYVAMTTGFASSLEKESIH